MKGMVDKILNFIGIFSSASFSLLGLIEKTQPFFIWFGLVASLIVAITAIILNTTKTKYYKKCEECLDKENTHKNHKEKINHK
jgi:hypothetical protein